MRKLKQAEQELKGTASMFIFPRFVFLKFLSPNATLSIKPEPASQPTLDQATAERFVRHAIGQPASAAGQSDDMEISTSTRTKIFDHSALLISFSHSSFVFSAADATVAESAQSGRRKGRALQPAKKSGPEMGGTARSLAVAPSAHVIWNELQQKGGLTSDELVEQFLKKTSGSS
jgi:hypothetical protein